MRALDEFNPLGTDNDKWPIRPEERRFRAEAPPLQTPEGEPLLVDNLSSRADLDDDMREAIRKYLTGKDARTSHEVLQHDLEMDKAITEFKKEHPGLYKHQAIAPSPNTYRALAVLGGIAVGTACFLATAGVGSIFVAALAGSGPVALIGTQVAAGLGTIVGWFTGGAAHNFFFRRSFKAGAIEISSRLKIAEESPAEPTIALEFMEGALKYMAYHIGGQELVNRMTAIRDSLNNNDVAFNPKSEKDRIAKINKLDVAREQLRMLVNKLDNPGSYLNPFKNRGSIYRKLPWNYDLTGDMTANIHKRFKAFAEVYIKMIMLNEMYRSTASFEARSHLERTIVAEFKPLISKEEGRGEMPFQQLLVAWKYPESYVAYQALDWGSLDNTFGKGKQKSDWQWYAMLAGGVAVPLGAWYFGGTFLGLKAIPAGEIVLTGAAKLGAFLKGLSVVAH